MSRVILTVVLLLGACSPPASYDDQYRREFVASCAQTSGSETACQCALRGLEAEMTRAELDEVAAAVRAGHDHPRAARVREISAACRSAR